MFWVNFIMNFNLSKKKNTFEELLYMLRTVELEVNKTVTSMLLVDAKATKAKGKGKGKGKAKAKSKSKA